MDEIIEETNSVWSSSESDIVPTGMIGLLYSGMYRSSTESGQALIDVVPDCPTNDCTFPNFESLAVCSACVNIAQKMERSCLTETTSKPGSSYSNVTQCTYSLPNGLKINQTTLTDDTLAVSAMLKPVEVYDRKGNILQTTVLNASTSAGNISADAHQCSLSWCVKTYEAKVVNGSLIEREIQSRADWDWLENTDLFFELSQWAIDTSLQNGRNVSAFAVTRDASIKITNWMYYKFTFSNSKYLDVQSTEDEDWFRFWEDESGNFTADDFRTVSHLRDTIKTMQLIGYEEVFSNIAKALTTYIRTDGSTEHRTTWAESSRDIVENLGPIEPVSGTVFIAEVYIQIRWP